MTKHRQKKLGLLQRAIYAYDPSDPGGRKLSLGVYLLRIVFALIVIEVVFYVFLIIYYVPDPLTAAEIAAGIPTRETPFPHKNLMELMGVVNNLFLFGVGSIYALFSGTNVLAKKYTTPYGPNGNGGAYGDQLYGDGRIVGDQKTPPKPPPVVIVGAGGEDE